MSLVALENVSVSFGPHDILIEINCEANRGDRIGLVGTNGAGKSTLLDVLAGLVPPSSGKRHLARTTSVALVEQDATAASAATTVRQEATSGMADMARLERELDVAAAQLADGDAAVARYGELLERFEAAGGFTYQSRIAQVLGGLGLPESHWDRPLQELSGGQRARVFLARALLAQPDVLLLDEPTNHLDLAGLQWLEAFLRRWAGTVIVASHDRYFLDAVATSIWHLDNRGLKSYPGNYSKFEGLAADATALQQKQYAAQQEYIARQEAFIRRYRAGQRAAEARGRAKKLARLERIEGPTRSRTARLSFHASRSGDQVLRATGLGVGYDGSVLLPAGDIEAIRGARIALMGSNGSGKTTLLKTIAGEVGPVEGSLRLGEGVKLAHYWQEAENLNLGATVLEELLTGSTISIQQARDLLGQFLFRGDDVSKLVSVLSGGERGRLALAKLVVSSANCLLLDEPTNHLDIPSRDALEHALAAFPGTFIFASHDRRLIGRLATELWLIEQGRLLVFKGTLEEFNQQADVVQEPARRPAQAPAPRERQLSAYARQKTLATLEEGIEQREQTLSLLTQQIDQASARGDVAAISELGASFEALQAELNLLIGQWSELAQETSGAGP